MGLFLASQFIFNICLTLDLPVPHCFDYYSCVVSFEIGMCVSPISFLKLFWLLGPSLQSHINLTISFSISAKKKKSCWNPISIESVDSFHLGYQICWHRTCLHRASSISQKVVQTFLPQHCSSSILHWVSAQMSHDSLYSSVWLSGFGDSILPCAFPFLKDPRELLILQSV